ncbi:WXG100 family type VII secretion target [Micrococcaceae bacterium RIT802]|nr:WXG100 family type VII secretion target [Micrococcaceae bacterium RIT 802]
MSGSFKGKMDVNAIGNAADQASGSGDELVRLVEELVDGVEDLRTTFTGAGAVSYQNFMVESQRVQKDLITALGGISRGQAQSAKEYVTMDDAFEAGGKAAEGIAAGAKTANFKF